MKNKLIALIFSSIVFVSLPVSAFAHAVVKPAEVKVAQYQTFTLGVPNEKDTPTTTVRLIIPEGVSNVSPVVKPGWKITIVKDPSRSLEEDAKVTEIVWSAGVIPVGMRDEFLFSAKTSSKEETVSWKVYQTYQNGVQVSWDKEGGSNEDSETAGPASHTKIINDLKTNAPSSLEAQNASSSSNLPFLISAASLALSAIAIFRSSNKK